MKKISELKVPLLVIIYLIILTIPAFIALFLIGLHYIYFSLIAGKQAYKYAEYFKRFSHTPRPWELGKLSKTLSEI